MSKYIKKINWPWVEIEDDFKTTVVINVNEISAVWDNSSTMYKNGIRWKNGTWNDNFPDESLAELKKLIMNYKPISTPNDICIINADDLELMHENQTLYEWLNEEGQA